MRAWSPTPIHDLPPGYVEVEQLELLGPGRVLLVNVLALIPLGAALASMALWWGITLSLRGPRPGPEIPWWLGLLAVLTVTLPLHEVCHGLAIRWAGHRPHYGVLLSKGAFYATADGALFPRDVFIFIALAPLVAITLAGMALVWWLPDSLGYYAALAVILNAGAAIGDLWMAWAARRYPPAALVRDEMDSIRIYVRP